MGLASVSLIFLFFVMPVFLIIYYWVPDDKKNIFALLVSFLFLFWVTPMLSVCMLIIACFNFKFCFLMYGVYFFKQKRKTVCLILILINLIIFIVFLLFGLDSLIYLQEELISKMIFSIFVCSNISYILDVYWKKCKLQRHLTDFLVYIFIFPKIFAGPIVQYNSIESQLKNRKVNIQTVVEGMTLFVIGFSQKYILSDSVKEAQIFVLYQTVSNISVGMAWLGAIVDFFYLYFCLYGYANMARGLGKMVGFEFPSNFRAILPASSVTNFFERWNISLIYWIKTYIKPCFRTSRLLIKIIFIIFGGLVGAMFFGGGLSKFLAAAYFVVVLIFERLFVFDILIKLPQLARKIYTFLLVLIGTVLFYQNSIGESLVYVKAMFGGNGIFLDKTFVFFVTSFAFILILCWLFSTNLIRNRAIEFKKKHKVIYPWLRYCFNLTLFIIAIAFCVTRLG